MSSHKQNYYNHLVETAIIFGANRTFAQRELMQVMEFEVALAKVSVHCDNYELSVNSSDLLFLLRKFILFSGYAVA